MKKLLLVGFVSSLLVGGATSLVIMQKAKNVPADRIMSYGKQNNNYAKVTIIRDEGLSGIGCYVGVMYRQTLLARFDVAEKAGFYIPKGEYDFSVISDPYGKLLCSYTFDPAVEKQIIKKDRDNIFRISINPWRRPRLLPVM